MYRWQKESIKIDKDSKIIIGLGDSFTQGEGACSVDVWEKYDWDLKKMSDREIRLDVDKSNFENSWVNQLCKNHLHNYIPINLGMTGRGNRAAVKEIYLHPDLQLEKAKEKIVVFMMTGYERFDFVHKKFFNHIHFYTMWPNVKSPVDESSLWDAYNEFTWSDRSGIIELLLSIAELKTWCQLNDATLVLTSAFRPEYTKNYFFEKIMGDVHDYMNEPKSYINGLVNIIDWDEFLRPNGFKCMTDYLCHLEEREDLISDMSASKYYEYSSKLEKLSPKGYITKCSHPSYLGHKKIAESIYEHIIKIKKNNENGSKKVPTNLI